MKGIEENKSTSNRDHINGALKTRRKNHGKNLRKSYHDSGPSPPF
jgi:hypothetical protein